MRIIRFEHQDTVRYGQLIGEQIFPIDGDIFGEFAITAQALAQHHVKLLPPLIPRHLYAIGLNYLDHVGELDFAKQLPIEPISFLVSSQAVIGHEEYIILNEANCRIDEEAELAVVIGKNGYQIAESQALDYVLGYTCGNDVSNRHRQNQDGQWFRAKSYPTYKPLGPWIETSLDPSDLEITATLNGQIVQRGRTSQLLFSVPKLIAFLSSFTPLYAGDVIMTGTPKGVSNLQNGDTVEITVEGIGTLRNFVKMN